MNYHHMQKEFCITKLLPCPQGVTQKKECFDLVITVLSLGNLSWSLTNYHSQRFPSIKSKSSLLEVQVHFLFWGANSWIWVKSKKLSVFKKTIWKQVYYEISEKQLWYDKFKNSKLYLNKRHYVNSKPTST